MPKPKSKPVAAPIQTVAFTLEDLVSLPDETLGLLIAGRVRELEHALPIQAKVDAYRECSAIEHFGRWFSMLPAAIAVGFFEATTWPPVFKEKQEPKRTAPKTTPDQKRKAKLAAAAVTPRAKRSKTKEELAEVRKANKAAAEVMGTSPRTRKAKKQASLPFVDDGKPIVSPRIVSPRIATGDQLAGDADERSKLLAFVAKNPNVSAATIQSECVLTPGQTKGLLKRLREQGAVIVDGKNRGAKYSAAVSNGAAART